jgi:hypothetical protein
MSGFWDGGFTDYGTSVGTVSLATITAVVAWREGIERRKLRAERDAATARADRVEQQQAADASRRAKRVPADGVSCYLDSVAYDPETVLATSGDDTPAPGSIMLSAIVRNLTEAPIRDVEVLWQNAAGPADTPSVVPSSLIPVVPPASLRALRRPNSMQSWHRPQMAITVRFTDTNGNRWARRDDGRLYSVVDGGALGPQET